MRPFNAVKRPLATLLLACAALAAWAQPLEVEGVKLEATSQLGAAKLQLNGAGLRTKVFFKVYVAALYTPQKATSAAQLLTQTGARRVTITMLREDLANLIGTAKETVIRTLRDFKDEGIVDLQSSGKVSDH